MCKELNYKSEPFYYIIFNEYTPKKDVFETYLNFYKLKGILPRSNKDIQSYMKWLFMERGNTIPKGYTEKEAFKEFPEPNLLDMSLRLIDGLVKNDFIISSKCKNCDCIINLDFAIEAEYECIHCSSLLDFFMKKHDSGMVLLFDEKCYDVLKVPEEIGNNWFMILKNGNYVQWNSEEIKQIYKVAIEKYHIKCLDLKSYMEGKEVKI